MLKKIIVETHLEQLRHNNGENHCYISRLHSIEDERGIYCSIFEKTTTREDFPGDRYEILIFKDGVFHLEDEEQVKDAVNIVYIEGYPVRFRQGEAEIIYQNPQAFINARKRYTKRRKLERILRCLARGLQVVGKVPQSKTKKIRS